MSSLLQNIAKASNYKLTMGMKAFPITGENVEQKLAKLDKIIYDCNVKRDLTWLKEEKRSYEIQRPGRHLEYYKRELVRKQNRQHVAFMCKYVLASKNIRIPKN